MPLCNFVEYIAVVKDLVLGGAAVVGSYVAIRGLKTWNRQLKGGVEYDLTRRLLSATYRWREAVRAVRRPVMWIEEMSLPSEEDRQKMSAEEVRHYGKGHAYQARWDKVVQAHDELQTELLEAEVLWGKQLHTKYKQAFQLQQELFACIHLYLLIIDPRTPQASREAYETTLRSKESVMYDVSTGTEEDQFTRDLSSVIAEIESLLKPRLKK